MRRLLSLFKQPAPGPATPPVPAQSLGLVAHLPELFTFLAINCVIDVGANQGQYGRFLRQLGFTGWIVSFEPNPADFAKLAQQADGDSRWVALAAALGDIETTLPMNMAGDSLFNSFLQPNAYIREMGLQVTAQVDVPVHRLDTIWPKIMAAVALDTPSIYLKMDTQGYDLKVLAGAAAVLSHIRAFQSEVSVRHLYEGMTNYLEAIAAMSGLGYEVTGLFPVVRDNALRVVEFDCVMIQTAVAGLSTRLQSP